MNKFFIFLDIHYIESYNKTGYAVLKTTLLEFRKVYGIMRIKIVADSSANMVGLDGVDFDFVPLKINTSEKEYVDIASLDVEAMASELSTYKGRSRTACPGVGEWLDAFEDYDVIFCVTIISVLSGSYNAAMTAKQQYEEENPGKQVFVLDSFSTGPEMKLHIYKLKEMIVSGMDVQTIWENIQEYKEKHTSLVFCLESMRNLANNGRVSPAVAKFASLIGIRVVGDVDEQGLHPTNKCRGEKKAIASIFENMKRLGYKGAKVIVDHCYNEKAANALKSVIRAEFPAADVALELTRGLCTFYAEKGGLIVGFEVN